MSEFEEGILKSLRRLTRFSGLYSRRLASRHGLTGPQVVCVRLLRRIGPTTPTVIAREMSLAQATVTGIVDRLHRQALVERTRDGVDRRRVLVGLTERGRQVAESAPSALQNIFSDRLAALPREEQRAIHDGLARIVEMMDEAALPASPAVAPLLEAEASVLALDAVLGANDGAPIEYGEAPPEEEA